MKMFKLRRREKDTQALNCKWNVDLSKQAATCKTFCFANFWTNHDSVKFKVMQTKTPSKFNSWLASFSEMFKKIRNFKVNHDLYTVIAILVYHMRLRTNGHEASSRLEIPGPQWALVPWKNSHFRSNLWSSGLRSYYYQAVLGSIPCTFPLTFFL